MFDLTQSLMAILLNNPFLFPRRKRVLVYETVLLVTKRVFAVFKGVGQRGNPFLVKRCLGAHLRQAFHIYLASVYVFSW